MSDNERHDALPPPRDRHPSLVEIVKEEVNKRLDSLLPMVSMNEEQLEILKRSEAERLRRAQAEAAKSIADAKADRIYKLVFTVLAIAFSALEAYRATHH